MTRATGLALAISLIVNVFLAGAIGGGLVMLSRQDGVRPGTPVRPIRAAGDGLPATDKQRFRRAMLHVIQANQDLLRTARDNRRLAAQLFVQPQFNRAGVAAALDRARDADVQLRIRLETAAIDFAAELPPDERKTLAQGLQRRGPLRHPPAPDQGANPP